MRKVTDSASIFASRSLKASAVKSLLVQSEVKDLSSDLLLMRKEMKCKDKQLQEKFLDKRSL